MVVLLLLALLGAALLLLALQRSRQRLPRRRGRSQLRSCTLFSLQIGDIVQAEASDWVVEERLLYDQAGFQWLEYLLRDGDRNRWLVVCEDDVLEVSWLEELERPALAPPPGWPPPPQLDCQGVAYQLQERGEAMVTAAQRQLNRRPGACRFADYRGPAGQLLALEFWGEPPAALELEVCGGRRIDPHSLSLLPGDGRSVYKP